ncbi:MAG: serine hydrolase, partial [Pseudomonadota bacterium]
FNTFFPNRDIDKSIRQYKRNREPGTDFDYISTNTSVLGAVVSGAYGGRSLSDLVGEKVFNPLGMQEGSWLLDRNARTGKELAYCCLNIRLEDYAKFGLLYLNDGVANGQKILPDGWVDFVRTPAHKDLHTPSLGKPVGYGQHFWIPPERDGSFYAAGYNGQFVWVDPNTNTVVALTSADQTYPGQVEVLDLLRAAARADISDMSAKASEVDKDGARL